MKYLLICLFLLACVSPVRADDAPRKPGPLILMLKPIDLDYGASPLLAVVFNHSTHKSFQCVLCHHKATEDNNRYAACTTKGCHSVPGARQRGADSMFMAYHAPTKKRSCYGCHKMEAPHYSQFVGCQPCHGPLKTTAAK